MKVSSYILQIYDMAGDVMMLKKLAAAVIAASTAIVCECTYTDERLCGRSRERGFCSRLDT